MKTPQNIPATEPLTHYINQNGVRPGAKKLEQFKQALTLRNTPKLYEQSTKAREAVAYVKIFDPTGSWTWFLTEWDGENEAFGLVFGQETELGYVSLTELSELAGPLKIGLEIDTHYLPTKLGVIREKNGRV